jgi:hypothetical protein
MLSSIATYSSDRKAMSVTLAASLRCAVDQGIRHGHVTLARRYVR